MLTDSIQAQKFGSFGDDEDEEIDEESLLETPLDKIEPYGLFKHVLLGMSSLLECFIHRTPIDKITGLQQEQPQLYENLTKILNGEEQQVLQAVFHEADAKAMEAANAQAAAAAAGMPTNGQ